MTHVERADLSDVDFWDRLVQSGPTAALELVPVVLGDVTMPPDARALALGAASRSHYETGDLRQALASARAGLDAAADCSHAVRSTVAMGASVVLAEHGFVDEALDRLSQLADESDGVELGRVRLQTAYVLQQAGRLRDALEEFDGAERLLRGSDAARDRYRVHLNRGLALLQQGLLAAAEADLDVAGEVAESTGITVVRAQVAANRAVLYGRARRIPEALREFDRAAALFDEIGNPARTVGGMSIDRAEVMMHSGLLVDAVEAGCRAVEATAPTGNAIQLGDAHLMTARAELAVGSVRSAVASAQQAAEIFVASGRSDMVPHAGSVMVRARLDGVTDAGSCASELDLAHGVISELLSAGWTAHADELAMSIIRAGRRWGLGELVIDDVARLRVGAADGRRDTALSGWWAEAIGRSVEGDADGAAAACHAGLTVLDDIVAEAPSLEARSAAMRMGADLSQLLIELAIERGDADTVFAAAEGTRARALHDELAELDRHLPLTRQGAEDLRRELAIRLGDRVLVEWVVSGESIWAVVVDSDQARLIEIGDRNEIRRSCDRVRMWLDVAAAEPDEPTRRAMQAARRLDDLLIAPLGLPADVGVVVVPCDVLHGIPWSGLPNLAERPCTLVPNAQVWLEADRRAVRPISSVGIVVGPGVVGSETERVAVTTAHPDARIAVGEGSTSAAARTMFAESDLVHVAAHGTFRSDYPLLSTLRLADGDATLYDAIPERVATLLAVLSSCEGGAQGTADGSEVLGLSAVLLARGAAAVLAPLTVVRELECADFVAEVHGELAAGEPFACAVAAVRRRWLAADDLSQWAVASSFSCFGSGAVRLAD